MVKTNKSVMEVVNEPVVRMRQKIRLCVYHAKAALRKRRCE